MAKVISFQGAGANCGKTTTLVGLLRVISEQGIAVAPFKSVSVLSKKSFGYLNPVEQLCQAAKIKYSSIHNPITIQPVDDTKGKLFLHGEYISEIFLTATDTPLFNSLDPSTLENLKKEIHNSIFTLMSDNQLILNEGASNPLDMIFFEEYDLSNFEILKKIHPPIILVVRAYDGGHWASLLGTVSRYSKAYKDQIKGVIVNEVLNNTDIFKKQLKEVCKQLNLTCYGVIPRVNYFDGVIESKPGDFESEYRVWAKIAEEFIDIENILKM